MQNSLIDLNNHLFAQLERLGDETLTQTELENEISRSKSIVDVAQQVICNARVVLDAHIARDQAMGKLAIPGIILGEKEDLPGFKPQVSNKRQLITKREDL